MKQVLYIFLCFILLSGCKKIKKTQEQIAEDLIVKAITDGRWNVTVYNDGTEYKAEFDVYDFQFKTNRTVDAIKNSATEATGTWGEDPLALTITADYPSNTNTTLQRLDGVWKIIDSTWTWVKATQTINGKLTTLELRKK